jgi:hypothetical protein
MQIEKLENNLEEKTVFDIFYSMHTHTIKSFVRYSSSSGGGEDV